MYLLFVDHILQGMDTRLLVAKNRYVAHAHTTTADESDTMGKCPAVRVVPRRSGGLRQLQNGRQDER